ncbi:MAG TPA: hypothetical protein VGB13_01365 [Candidatus Krumholzibacteria bacterium]|jgi:hydroxymethylbilane synthase
MSPAITIGANDVGLARAQAEWLATLVRATHPQLSVNLELLNTQIGKSPLHDDHVAENRTIIRVLHDCLRDGDVDIVIHNAFDLRSKLPDDLRLGCILPRRSPYDALLCVDGRTFDELDPGERVGVVQLRARAQLLDHRPDISYRLIHGDVGNWLTALLDAEIKALVAPNAALELLGLQERVTELFPPELIVPAPGSGLLLCLCRGDDRDMSQMLGELHDPAAAAEYHSEVAFVRALGDEWERPVGALAQQMNRGIGLMGVVASPDGSEILRRGIQTTEHSAQELGEALAELMIDEGALRIIGGESDASPAASIVGVLTTDADWSEQDEWDEEDWEL